MYWCTLIEKYHTVSDKCVDELMKLIITSMQLYGMGCQEGAGALLIIATQRAPFLYASVNRALAVIVYTHYMAFLTIFKPSVPAARASGFLRLLWCGRQYVCLCMCVCVCVCPPGYEKLYT